MDHRDLETLPMSLLLALFDEDADPLELASEQRRSTTLPGLPPPPWGARETVAPTAASSLG